MSGRMQICISAVVLAASLGIAAIMIGVTKYISSIPDEAGFQTDWWPKVSNTTHIGHIEIFTTNTKRHKVVNNSYYWLDDPLIENGVFTTRFVSDRDMGKNTLLANCSEEIPTNLCIKKASLDTLLQTYPDTKWFVYYTDPFFMNLTNLNRYLQILNEFYNPSIHLVAKAAVIPGYEHIDLIYSHSVVIKSRAFIEFEIAKKLTAPDIANNFDADWNIIEAVVIEEILSVRDWMEPFLVNTECANCGSSSKIMECFGFKFLLTMKDAIAWNRVAGDSEINQNWMSFDDQTFFYYDKHHHPHVCTAVGDIVITSLSLKHLTTERKRIKASDVPMSKIRAIWDGTCKQCAQMRMN